MQNTSTNQKRKNKFRNTDINTKRQGKIIIEHQACYWLDTEYDDHKDNSYLSLLLWGVILLKNKATFKLLVN